MTVKRQIKIFSAGCPACSKVIDLVNKIACPSCEISILDMNNDSVSKEAENFGVKSVPAVVVDDRLLDCCKGGPSEVALREAGIGEAIS